MGGHKTRTTLTESHEAGRDAHVDASTGFLHTQDGLFNYEVEAEVARGSRSVVYTATCRKGRLRGRVIVLKKILFSASKPSAAGESSSSHLHQALHHPSILSMLSSFDSPFAHYQVLEYCSNGSLSNILATRLPPVLSEDELRGVSRNLVDALVYLRKELVLHRDIRPSNILINEHWRIKLSGFDHAYRMPHAVSTIDDDCDFSEYSAPEMTTGKVYGFPSDIWSLGCVMAICLSGMDISDRIPPSAALPDTLSYEAKDLVSGLVQIGPDDRVPLHRILSHPYFNPSLPAKSLTLPHLPNGGPPITPRGHQDKLHPLQSQAGLKPRYPTSLGRAYRPARMPSVRVGSTPSPLLPEGFTPEKAIPSTRRVFSAPDSWSTSTQWPTGAKLKPQASSDTLTSSDVPTFHSRTDSVTSTLTSSSLEQENTFDELKSHPLLCPPKPARAQSRSTRHVVSSSNNKENQAIPISSDTETAKPSKARIQPSERCSRKRSVPSQSPPISAVSLGAPPPTALNTSYLTQQTHKLAQGQLTVLPSLSVLADLREGERRKGRRGVEVLVISPDGTKIEVHSAPHLSSPCCLTEPIATYTIHELPPSYWKLYNECSRIIQQLKKRIPKLVLYRPEAKCTLMANEPLGDIEIHCGSESDKTVSKGKGAQVRESLRIFLSRATRTMEISRYTPPKHDPQSNAGEWSKKVLRLVDDAAVSLRIIEEDRYDLDCLVTARLRILEDFLVVCHAAENLEHGNVTKLDVCQSEAEESSDDTVIHDPRSHLAAILRDTKPVTPLQTSSSVVTSALTAATSGSSGSTMLSGLRIAPRPPRIPSGSTTCFEKTTHDVVDSDNSRSSTQPRMQFAPTVGWYCRTSDNSKGDQYQVLFLDGVSIQVNVGDGSIEIAEQDGKISTYSDREWARIPTLRERMHLAQQVRASSDDD
ncbi:kinase-like protein [Panus rudis PR-1116 ss-1]|nr:kinase-like protein [Panus rudis PR-1116 ss-1]